MLTQPGPRANTRRSVSAKVAAMLTAGPKPASRSRAKAENPTSEQAPICYRASHSGEARTSPTSRGSARRLYDLHPTVVVVHRVCAVDGLDETQSAPMSCHPSGAHTRATRARPPLSLLRSREATAPAPPPPDSATPATTNARPPSRLRRGLPAARAQRRTRAPSMRELRCTKQRHHDDR